MKSFEICACFGDSCISLVIDKHISGQGTAEICELVYSLQLLTIDCDLNSLCRVLAET